MGRIGTRIDAFVNKLIADGHIPGPLEDELSVSRAYSEEAKQETCALLFDDDPDMRFEIAARLLEETSYEWNDEDDYSGLLQRIGVLADALQWEAEREDTGSPMLGTVLEQD